MFYTEYFCIKIGAFIYGLVCSRRVILHFAIFRKKVLTLNSIAVLNRGIHFFQLLIRFAKPIVRFQQFYFRNSLVPCLVRTAQGLTKVKFYSFVREKGLSCEKRLRFSKTLSGKIQFSQKSLIHKKLQPQILLQQDLV